MSDVKIVPAICLIFYLEVTTKLVILAHYADSAFCHCDKGFFPRGLTACLPLEKEAKSGYHTAQDGIAFTVVHQTTTRKRSAAEADADCTDTKIGVL
jgi:hypothetical protein